MRQELNFYVSLRKNFRVKRVKLRLLNFWTDSCVRLYTAVFRVVVTTDSSIENGTQAHGKMVLYLCIYTL